MKKILFLLCMSASINSFASATWNVSISNATPGIVTVYGQDDASCFGLGNFGSISQQVAIPVNGTALLSVEESNGTIGQCARADNKYFTFAVVINGVATNMKLSETGDGKWETPIVWNLSTKESATTSSRYKQNGGIVNVGLLVNGTKVNIGEIKD